MKHNLQRTTSVVAPCLVSIFLLAMVVSDSSELFAASGMQSSDSCVDMVQNLGSPLDLTPEAQITISNWLECEECTTGSLTGVKRLGPGIVPIMACALYKGPRSERLKTSYDFLNQQFSEQPINASSSLSQDMQNVLIKTQLVHLVVQYQIRAAIALGAIDNADARRALVKALDPTFGLKLSDSVRSTVQRTLKTMKTSDLQK